MPGIFKDVTVNCEEAAECGTRQRIKMVVGTLGKVIMKHNDNVTLFCFKNVIMLNKDMMDM